MANIHLATALMRIQVAGAQKANQVLEKSKGKFSKFGSTVKSAAGQVPILGGALQQMLTPMGAATVAGTAFVGFLVSSVKHVIDLEKNLRPMIERSNLSAESLQELTKVAERLGSEDGLEGVTDGAQELQLRLAEAVADGTGPAVEAFAKLGLASEDLIKKSPEESFLDVIGALQEYDDEAQKKFLADELMGGASEKLSGIINTNAEDFANLRSEIQQTHRFMTDEELVKVQGYATAMEETGASVDDLKTTIGLELLPIVAEGAKVFESAVDKSQDFGVTLVGMAATVLPAAAIAYRLFNDEGEALVETAEEVTVALVEEKEAIEEVTEAAVEGINAQLLSVQNKRDAVKEYQEWYRTYVDGQLAEFDREEEAFTFQIGNLEGLRDAAIKAAADRNDKLVADALETAQEKAEIAEEEEEIARLALIAEIKASVRREKLLHKFKFLSADVQDEIREDAYQHGRKLTDVIEDYLENILNVHIDTNDKLEDDDSDTLDRRAEDLKEFLEANDETVLQLRDSNIGFTELLKALAVENGQTLKEFVAAFLEAEGEIGDVFDLIEQHGNDAVKAMIAQILKLRELNKPPPPPRGGGVAGRGRGPLRNEAWAREQLSIALRERNHARILGRTSELPDLQILVDNARNTLTRIQESKGVPQLADGGIVRNPMLANIGEAGPEAVIPLDQFGGGGFGATVQILGDIWGFDDFVDKVGEAGILIGRRGG